MDIKSRQDLESIVESFYSKAMKNETIGYIFTDVAQLDLSTHLPKIVDFWESVLFGAGKYQGNPVRKHVALNQKSDLKDKHFRVWLALWEETVKSHHHGPKTDEMVAKAKLMGALMKYKIKASSNTGFVQ